jgi:hypothetical protein
MIRRPSVFGSRFGPDRPAVLLALRLRTLKLMSFASRFASPS